RSGSQYIEANAIDYNRKTGAGKAAGKVVAIDTAQHATLWSGYAIYNEISRTLFATMKPVLRNESGKDTIYIAADTYYSAPQVDRPITKVQSADSVAADSPKGKKPRKRTGPNNPNNSNAPQPADSTAPRLYIGYHNVRIWSDSLQGVCDSISYSAKDSVMK